MKRRLPQIRAEQLERVEFSPPAGALERWNAALRAETDDNSISLYGVIGDSYGGVTVSRIASALRSIGAQDVTVNINSPGGDFFEGVAIYNLLRDHPHQVTVRIIGLAASAASVIAMAGDRIEIAKSASVMIHKVWSIVIGNSDDLREAAKVFDRFDDTLAELYSERSGQAKQDVAGLLAAETWFNGNEAVAHGFADALMPADQLHEDETEPAHARALRRIEAALACQGIPRSERRSLLKQLRQPDPDDGIVAQGFIQEIRAARASLSKLISD